MNLLKNEFLGWKKLEGFWLLIACTIITFLSMYWGDSLMGIISSTTGVACVVCTGKGKLSAYVFGLVNCVLYAIISYKAKLYGEVMLNICYIPFQFYGFYTWKKNMNIITNEVTKRLMDKYTCIKYLIITCVAVMVYGYILRYIGGVNPFLDSFTTVLSIFAMIISIKMYAEQWIVWIMINIVSIVLWANQLLNGTESISTLLMWIVYLLNSIVMAFKWYTEAYKNEN